MPVFEEVTFFLEFVEACFVVPVPVEVSMIVSQADFSEEVFLWDGALEVRFLVEGLISIALL